MSRETKRQRTNENGKADGEEGGGIAALRDNVIENWKEEIDAADQMIPLIGKLYRHQNIICTNFRTGLVHKNGIEIVKIHNFVCKYIGHQVRPKHTLRVLKALVLIDGTILKSMRLDLGKTYLVVRKKLDELEKKNSGDEKKVQEELSRHLAVLIENSTGDLLEQRAHLMNEPRNVVLYGFGRIGRLLARLLIEKSGSGAKMMLRAIVVRKGQKDDLFKRASLLRRDSVHGQFHGTISVNEDANAIIANGSVIQVIYSSSPDQCDYTQYGIEDAVVIDNTGKWRDEKALSMHLKSKGVSKVILTAPGKDKSITTIVSGVNDDRVNESCSLYSAASCTTNAIVPVLSALHTKYGIESGHIETVHSFTNDQNLIDNYHDKERRGRSAVLNMVLTETGAAKAVSMCLPDLEGKLTANAIRVPTPNVSLAILILKLNTKDGVCKEDVNKYIAGLSIDSSLQKQIGYVDSKEVVSSDFVGNRCSSIVDGQATIVKGDQLNLYVWYDNEFGYSCQVIRILQDLCGIKHVNFPRNEALKHSE